MCFIQVLTDVTIDHDDASVVEGGEDSMVSREVVERLDRCGSSVHVFQWCLALVPLEYVGS